MLKYQEYERATAIKNRAMRIEALMKTKRFFLTLEGPEGCGKSTHAKLLYDYFLKNGYKAVHTREPGGTGIAEAIRHILLNPKYKVAPISELLLYEASRYQHTEEVIRPNLRQNKIVLCERYTDATVAYQGYGRGIDLKIISQLNKIATANLVPDLTIYLDIDVEDGLGKAKRKKDFSDGDRIEKESIEFHRKVRNGYLRLARKESKRIKVIRICDDISQTHRKVLKAVMDKMK